MDFLANDLSIHNQFHDFNGLRDALRNLLELRKVAKRFGRDIHCHREFILSKPINNKPLQQAVANFPEDSQRRVILSWLARVGPFWDDVRCHGEDDYLECLGEVVTNTAVGEAAFRNLYGVSCCGVVSLIPSNWLKTPLLVTWHTGNGDQSSEVTNVWDVHALEAILRDKASPPCSWNELQKELGLRFSNLNFSNDCFLNLSGVPFSRSAADGCIKLFGILNRLACAFDENGDRNAEGHRIIENYFQGSRALFSDSSDTEKIDFVRK